MGQQYLQIYGVPGAAMNTTVYPYGQLGQAIPMQGYTVSGHQIVPYGGSNVNAITTSPMPVIQSPYPSGTVVCPKVFSVVTWAVPFCCILNMHFTLVNLIHATFACQFNSCYFTLYFYFIY